MAHERLHRVVIAGSAANPPHVGHRALAEALLAHRDGDGTPFFDLVLWYPSGTRSDKPDTVHPDHRVAMTNATLGDLAERNEYRFRIRYHDAYTVNTPTVVRTEELAREFPGTAIWCATGSDVLLPRPCFQGRCEVAATWRCGAALLRTVPFAVIPRDGAPMDAVVAPSRCITITPRDGSTPRVSSGMIRAHIARGNHPSTLASSLHPATIAYIAHHGLYQRENSPTPV